MPRDVRVLLFEAREAAEQAIRFLGETTLEEYERDEYRQAAVERKIQIIGEALNVARHQDPLLDEQISDLPKIVGTRHFLVHVYHAVKHEKIWDVVHVNLPVLLGELREILGPDPEASWGD